MKPRMLLLSTLLICSCPLLAHAQYPDPYRDQVPPPAQTYRDPPPPPEAYRDDTASPVDRDYPRPANDGYAAPPPPVRYRDASAPPPPPVQYRDAGAPPPPVQYRDAAAPPPVRYRDTTIAPPPPATAYRDATPLTHDPYASNARGTARYETPDGQLTVHSSQPGPRNFGPPPDFGQIDRRNAGYVTAEDAAAYPPLANDFIYADSNRDGRVSREEYRRWAAHQ